MTLGNVKWPIYRAKNPLNLLSHCFPKSDDASVGRRRFIKIFISFAVLLMQGRWLEAWKLMKMIYDDYDLKIYFGDKQSLVSFVKGSVQVVWHL